MRWSSKELRCTHSSLFLWRQKIITNTAYRKHAHNITTWVIRLQTHCIFNQDKYIICGQQAKQLSSNAQSREGNLTSSDHKLVTIDFDSRALCGLRRRHDQTLTSKADTRLATHTLIYDSKYRIFYRHLLENDLDDLPQERTTTDKVWTITLNSSLEDAANSVDCMKIVKHTEQVYTEPCCL